MNNSRYQDLKLAERGALLSIWAYVILSVIKLTFATMTNSESLRADAFNNITAWRMAAYETGRAAGRQRKEG